MAVESVSGCSWNECPDQRGISVRMLVEWVSGWSWNPQVRLEPSAGTIFNRNIFAVSMTGEVLWQIDESSHGTQADKPFMSLYRDENDQVVVSCWNGVTYAVDVENGKIRVIQFDR